MARIAPTTVAAAAGLCTVVDTALDIDQAEVLDTLVHFGSSAGESLPAFPVVGDSSLQAGWAG